MTKQQEIRERIENIISGQGYYFPYAEATQEILAYLHSKDVAIVTYPPQGSDLTGCAIVAVEPLIEVGIK